MSFWNDPLRVAADWLQGIFMSWGMNEIIAHVLVVFLGVFLLITLLMVLDIFLVWICLLYTSASQWHRQQ